MRILLTGMCLSYRTGEEIYVAELAHGLRARGHDVVVLVTVTGELSRELVAEGFSVVTRLPRHWEAPDVIHAQTWPTATMALDRYPGVPALFVCHHHSARVAVMPPHPAILRYAGVSEVCVRRLLETGAPPGRTMLLPNYADTALFTRRPPLPPQPQRVLMFSNYAREDGYLPAVRRGCELAGLDLDVAGSGVGRTSKAPQEILGDYDIVLAKGRAAIEAMAVGCAVVLCDFAGLGPMVNTRQFDELRNMNFGFAALRDAHSPEGIADRLTRYDADDAKAVTDRIRSEASLEAYLDRLEALYAEMLSEPLPTLSVQRSNLHIPERVKLAATSLAARAWYRVPRHHRERVLPMRDLTRRVVRRTRTAASGSGAA